jgi:hypothetical protein
MDGSSVTREAHHAAPRCLITLHEKANGTTSLDGEGIQAWLEWEWEAMRWCVPVEISKEDLEALVTRSTVVLEREKHRLIHEGDWRRWGSRGGRETLRRYGPGWFSPCVLRASHGATCRSGAAFPFISLHVVIPPLGVPVSSIGQRGYPLGSESTP